MLRSYESLMTQPIYGGEPDMDRTGQEQGSRAKVAQPTSAERAKAQQAKEATFIWKDNGNGRLINQHGQLKTKHVALVEEVKQPEIAAATIRQMLDALYTSPLVSVQQQIVRMIYDRLRMHGEAVGEYTSVRTIVELAKELTGYKRS